MTRRAVRLHLFRLTYSRSKVLHYPNARVRTITSPHKRAMIIMEILKSYLLILPTFSRDVSNNQTIRSMSSSLCLGLLLPQLQLVCLGRGLVGYWRGYFNHKRCRRRCTFKLYRRYEFFVYPKFQAHTFVLNKAFDLLRESGDPCVYIYIYIYTYM